uniref:PHP domain-containing protein n=1 Tax=uncultured marine group II/III euryarchaeote KM3_195_B08 TaxID=1457970 RepID=A0A075GSL5_9EURY|nr:PHP domain-containing protein [uncultured marine group II/III euryarchaeote KM3_195_B08]
MKIDFHVHTSFSPDASSTPKDLIKKSRELGILPAITDHNTINAHKFFKESKIPFIPGEEIKSDVGDLIALFIQEEIPKGTPFLDCLDKIKEQGGVSILPHGFDPYRSNVGSKYSEYAKKVDVVEIFNAHCLNQKQNNKAKEFAIKNKKLFSCGGDSHHLFEFGKTYAELPEFDLENPKSLLKSLKKIKIHGKILPFFTRVNVSIRSKFCQLKNLF